MKREYGLDQVERDPNSVVTVGTFDGIHRGHQAILQYLRTRAAERHGASVVVSFDPHPREIVKGESVLLLTTIDERADLLERIGIDRFIVVPFTKDFARLTAEAFVSDVLISRIGLKEIVVGHDHGFGRGRMGDRALLEVLGREHGFTVDVIPSQVVEEHVVSSTEIRRLLIEDGNVQLAAEMLGRNYSLQGEVVHGDGRGRLIGFPTANIQILNPRKVIPRKGVYAVIVSMPGHDDEHYEGMLNIGERPTFNGSGLRVEVNLLDYTGDLYGRMLRIEFVRWMRDERKFESVEALIEQLSEDKRRCKETLESLF
ncbi:MAG TPA: bifunctional riboflavin kinase/FAD synthetase [Rhodothermales bacterium]|nr:bifunctional riboflavin kinase/FAD synthetase [Rhodothermales bacterium]